MSRRKPSPFQNCETREAFLAALQQGLASGKLSAVELNAAKLLCKMKGWGTPAETSQTSVTPEVEYATVATPVLEGESMWHWREDSKSPWSPPLTTEQMAETYNRVAAAGVEAEREAVRSTKQYQENPAGWQFIKALRHWSVSVLTPKGLQQSICCALPCTVQDLDNLNEEPPPDNSHW